MTPELVRSPLFRRRADATLQLVAVGVRRAVTPIRWSFAITRRAQGEGSSANESSVR
ncbi:hypothetical protein trd_A0379 (plasmid) [Thermomicrobium roseum DSM 5159]|uniref:Uncharacterized protein n=1 Tax=Thermomicrobium roseum (strain ATCC 27502 / DSM 5159 / P-2) TaxID=309801 RepID=B9L3L5_THERP|nr:hypothetical protein trd_A0379 [Thermomicrobium roseum DSM 5159]